ncbi:MAG: VanW family protein [Parcubacteria bacterium 34_609]|nr:MAG: VanW family protein [Parcubacteria bacterium 34_609]
MLKPGEEFSTINALGEIDENNGYLKEAVIKNDAIVYEFGGGLPPQKMECTLIPYDGLDAYFDYEIIYPNGEVRKKRFESHYIPRQGICLLGN